MVFSLFFCCIVFFFFLYLSTFVGLFVVIFFFIILVVMLHLVICLITGILFFQIFTTLPLYHKERFNMTEFDSGLLLSLNGLLILLFELPIVNYVSRNKINNHKVISIGLLLMTISFFLL